MTQTQLNLLSDSNGDRIGAVIEALEFADGIVHTASDLLGMT